MPVQVRERIQALVEDAGNRSRAADLLGVHRSRITRWLASEEPDEANRRAIDAFEFAIERLTTHYRLDTAFKWLAGVNPHLGGARPMDLLRDGRIAEVLAAIEADDTGAYS